MSVELFAAALVEDNEVFLLRRMGQDKWMMPSGQLTNTGTSELQVREMLLTSLGVCVLQIGQPMIIAGLGVDGVPVSARYYQVANFIGDPVVDEKKYPEACWVRADRLPHYPVSEVDRSYINHLIEVGVLVQRAA